MVDAESDSGSSSSCRSHRVQFIPARDSRNRRIPGPYLRNDRYYAQLWIDKGDGTKTARKMPLLDDADKPITTLVAAREALEVKRHQRRESILPTPGFKPTLAAYTETYFAKAIMASKRPGTIQNETQAMARWKAHMGGLRLDKIALLHEGARVHELADGVFQRVCGGVGDGEIHGRE